MTRDLVVRAAGAGDVATIAALRALWSTHGEADPGFEQRIAAWLDGEGDRRTTWLAERAGSAIGLASLFEYRRMPLPGRPDSRWGYVGNLFVREDCRGRGAGSALLAAIVAAADERGYARLVLSPSAQALGLFRRAGFVVPDGAAGNDRLLVRPGRAG